jgi:23S rRNA pseudouridine1911/1915/1917 synthase
VIEDLTIGADARHIYLRKPPGVPVFPPHADPDGDCVLRRWLGQAGPGPWPEGFEGGIAHRLDTATSGVLVAARTPADLERLRAEMRDRRLRKFYVLRSHGSADFAERVLETPIAHHPRRRDRMVVRRGPRTTHRGKWYEAWTRLRRLGGGLWEAEIRTGVMHQIRVHAASVGLPLTGDAIYGGAPGPFLLHHARIAGPGWASPFAPPPAPLPASGAPCPACAGPRARLAGGAWCPRCAAFVTDPASDP